MIKVYKIMLWVSMKYNDSMTWYGYILSFPFPYLIPILFLKIKVFYVILKTQYMQLFFIQPYITFFCYKDNGIDWKLFF